MLARMADQVFDPLASLRAPGDPDVDVLVWGTVFLDIIFTGLERLPEGGEEVWADGMGSCPGGIANLAVAARRLGLRTSLAAAFGDDAYGDFCWETLEAFEHIDLSRSRRFEGWHSPVTISMAVHRDRGMVSHGHPAPVGATELIGRPPRARAVMASIGEGEGVVGRDEPTWVQLARDEGALVFADVGWDPSGTWPREVLDQLEVCHGFLPNAGEAMAYTHTDSPREALYTLADMVPLAVVTNGSEGALAIDSTTGEECHMPALRVEAMDATGAGDVFGAGIVLGTLSGWSLEHRLAFAAACSALAVQQFGGSLAAPGWGDIADWWHGIRAKDGQGAYHRSLLRRFGFLEDVIPEGPLSEVRRATATVARFSDAGQPHSRSGTRGPRTAPAEDAAPSAAPRP